MGKNIKKNYIYNVSYQLLILITPLITTPYISRVLGANGIGKISYLESIVANFTLFATMGVTTYGQREISYTQKNIEKRSIAFWNIKLFSVFATSLVLAVFLVFSYFQQNSYFYFPYIFNFLSIIVDVNWLFQGVEEFEKIFIRNIIFKIINILFIFGFIHSKEDLFLYIIGQTFLTFLSNISLWHYMPNYVKIISKNNIHIFSHVRGLITLFVPTIATHIYTVLDKTMIGVITHNEYENGYYEQAVKLTKMVLVIITSLVTVTFPRMGVYYEQDDKNAMKKLMYEGYRFVWFLGVPLCLGLAIVSNNFVPWFFGEGYENVIPLIRILSFLIIAIGINSITGMQYLIPTKCENILTITVVSGAFLNFILNIILIPKYCSMGAAFASVIAETFIAVLQIIIVRKEINPKNIILEGKNYFAAGAIMATIVKCMENGLSPSITNSIILTLSGGVIYFIILLFMKDKLMINNTKLLISKVKRR